MQSFLEFSLTFAQLQDSLRQLVNGKAGERKSEWMDRLTFVNFRIFLSEISWKPLSAQTEKHATGSRDFPCCARIMASKHCKIMCFYLPPEDHSCSCNVTIEPFVRQRYTLNEECQYHLTHVNLLTKKKKNCGNLIEWSLNVDLL